jgi:hypothetical protein
MRLVDKILDHGCGSSDAEVDAAYFPGDDLFAACRPRGLPIGNLTSQFWSNCFLHALDLFVLRELGCRAYLRYVDDFALFADDRALLWDWKRAIVDRLARLRLRLHANSAQVTPTACGVPWLGFVVHPDHVRVKSRKVVEATRRLDSRWLMMLDGEISFGEFDASVQGWINHVAQADSWGLRRRMLEAYAVQSGERTAHAGRGRWPR